MFRGFIRGKGVGRILKSATLELEHPLYSITYPDTLIVAARTLRIDKDRLTQNYIAISQKLLDSGKEEGAIVAQGDAIIGMKELFSDSLILTRFEVIFDHVLKRKALVPEEFESGRIAYFDHVVGKHLSQKEYDDFIKARKVGPILKSASIKYIAPVEYPDTLTIGVTVDKETIGADRFVQKFKAISHKLNRVVAEGEAVIVTYDYENKKKANIPMSQASSMPYGQLTQSVQQNTISATLAAPSLNGAKSPYQLPPNLLMSIVDFATREDAKNLNLWIMARSNI
ncbi:hypothetical protein HDU97_009595 [Phlyctochytrium planicorne]|nr:hypothetical protein HDU97_009595 [Phlyctochytrium planicorne]